MGDDEWTLREPGSATGSYVPPPATSDEPPQSPAPLPRRKPQANWPQRASGNKPPPAGSVRPDKGNESPRPGRPSPPAASQASTRSGSARIVSGPGQGRHRLVESDDAGPPPLPDNVRYLFNPMLTPPVAKPDAESPGEPPANRPVGSARPAQASRTTASAGSSGAPAADHAVVASLPRRSDSPPRDEPLAEGAAPKPATQDAPSGGSRARRWVTWAAAVLLIVAAAIGTAFAFLRHAPPPGSAGSHHQQTREHGRRTGSKAIGGLSTAAIIRSQAAQWIVSQVSKSAIIGCDEVMCNDLMNQGIAASNLLVLGTNAPDPLGADIMVGTPALRSQFGSRLATEYAPTVIASFGTGKSRVDVRAVALYGAAAYIRAENRDLAARQLDGSTLLHNGEIAVAPAARPDLIAGLIDSRLLVMLPVLASQHPIHILGFYDRAPRSALGVPLTGAELAGADSASGLSSASYRRWLLRFLRGQRPPFSPVSVTTGLVDGHEVVVRVRFARPSPIGLLNSAVSGGL